MSTTTTPRRALFLAAAALPIAALPAVTRAAEPASRGAALLLGEIKPKAVGSALSNDSAGCGTSRIYHQINALT